MQESKSYAGMRIEVTLQNFNLYYDNLNRNSIFKMMDD